MPTKVRNGVKGTYRTPGMIVCRWWEEWRRANSKPTTAPARQRRGAMPALERAAPWTAFLATRSTERT